MILAVWVLVPVLWVPILAPQPTTPPAMQQKTVPHEAQTWTA